jgi:uncharacterized repeat protein (TIGR02543 family)
MKKFILRFMMIGLVLFIAPLLVGCFGDNGDNPGHGGDDGDDGQLIVETLGLSKTTIVLDDWQNTFYMLRPIVNGVQMEYGYSDALLWTSSDTSVATVELQGSGTVQMVNFGSAVITVTSIANPSINATADVIVAPVMFTITFDSMGGSPIQDVQIRRDHKLNQPTPPTRTGFAFGGWYYIDHGNQVGPNWDNNMVQEDRTYYARWHAIPDAPIIRFGFSNESGQSGPRLFIDSTANTFETYVNGGLIEGTLANNIGLQSHFHFVDGWNTIYVIATNVTAKSLPSNTLSIYIHKEAFDVNGITGIWQFDGKLYSFEHRWESSSFTNTEVRNINDPTDKMSWQFQRNVSGDNMLYAMLFMGESTAADVKFGHLSADNNTLTFTDGGNVTKVFTRYVPPTLTSEMFYGTWNTDRLGESGLPFSLEFRNDGTIFWDGFNGAGNWLGGVRAQYGTAWNLDGDKIFFPNARLSDSAFLREGLFFIMLDDGRVALARNANDHSGNIVLVMSKEDPTATADIDAAIELINNHAFVGWSYILANNTAANRARIVNQINAMAGLGDLGVMFIVNVYSNSTVTAIPGPSIIGAARDGVFRFDVTVSKIGGVSKTSRWISVDVTAETLSAVNYSGQSFIGTYEYDVPGWRTKVEFYTNGTFRVFYWQQGSGYWESYSGIYRVEGRNLSIFITEIKSYFAVLNGTWAHNIMFSADFQEVQFFIDIYSGATGTYGKIV